MSSENDKVDLTDQAAYRLKVKNFSLTPYTDAVQCRKVVNHIKRPMNPFMIWSQQERRKILEQNPSIQCADISVQLGKRWKALSNQERIPFAKEAERLRVLHSQEFPDYKFSPKKRKKKTPQSCPVSGNLGKEVKKFMARNNLEFMTNKKIETNEIEDEKNQKSISEPISSVFSDDKTKLNAIKNEESIKIEQAQLQKAGTSKECLPKALKRKNFESNSKDGLQLWNSLKEINITSLPIDKSDSVICKSDDQLKTTNSAKKTLPPRLHIDNCLTSGSIAALACYREDWSAAFDYLTDKVLQSSKNIYEEIDNISKQYDEAIKDENKRDFKEPSELNIPDINKVLGKKWQDPNFGLQFTS